ncbi:chemotaxis protein CheA [Halomonas alkaliantarctica]|nr:chemotaxis protein CheA [Halomonas alkaliantarctica]
MNPLLQSFINEARDNLEVASRCLLALEQSPNEDALLDELFRAMHTIKGASGLFDNLTEFSRLLHVIEDGLDQVRSHTLPLTPELTDVIFDALDVITQWLDSVEATESLPESAPAQLNEQLAALNQAMQQTTVTAVEEAMPSDVVSNDMSIDANTSVTEAPEWVQALPDNTRRSLVKASLEAPDATLMAVVFTPPEECFFQGHDPLQNVKTLPGLQVMQIAPRQQWPMLEILDPYQCVLNFSLVALAQEDEVHHHFRYLTESVSVEPLAVEALIRPSGEWEEDALIAPFIDEALPLAEAGDWASLRKRLTPLEQLSGETLYAHSVVHWLALALRFDSPPQTVILGLIDALREGHYQPRAPLLASADALSTNSLQPVEAPLPNVAKPENGQGLIHEVLAQQIEVLDAPVSAELFAPRFDAVAHVVRQLVAQLGDANEGLEEAITRSREQQNGALLQQWLTAYLARQAPEAAPSPTPASLAPSDVTDIATPAEHAKRVEKNDKAPASGQTIRVEQQRIDELMTLAGELVVAKNALPFLAKSANEGMSSANIAKELTSHYANIDRIADRMQQAVMGARMVPLSVVFQRFPRLVRDMTRKLDKQAELVLEGEETEADKHVVDHLADPLVHLVRNSLDHALEGPAERQAAGKPANGMIKLRAQALDDQVLIEVIDDGRGIDAEKLKQKAYQRGLIDEQKLDTITHQEALQLIFAAGLSTAEKVSDISGRGVGMDAVRTAVAASGGQISVASEAGKGTTIRILLPLSMAVARVMMVRIGEQDYGIAMANIRETVRVPVSSIHRIKRSENIVLRDKLIPLKRMSTLLNLAPSPPRDEEAILIVEVEGQLVGLVIDDFRQGIDIVQKPMEGIMANYGIYAGSALMGDGRVLLVLNLSALLESAAQTEANQAQKTLGESHAD